MTDNENSNSLWSPIYGKQFYESGKWVQQGKLKWTELVDTETDKARYFFVARE